MMVELDGIPVAKNIQWSDDRPCCQHVIESWRIRRDTGNRCQSYERVAEGEHMPGVCPMGGLCAMDDPSWVFKPGWDRWAAWRAQGHTHIQLDVWPRFQPGHVAVYVVEGDCMTPTYNDRDTVVVRLGQDWQDGDAVVIQRLVPDWGIPLKGRFLKRLERIGDDMVYVTADNPAFEPMLLPADAVKVVGVVQAVDFQEALGELTPLYTFDPTGRIVSTIQAVAVTH